MQIKQKVKEIEPSPLVTKKIGYITVILMSIFVGLVSYMILEISKETSTNNLQKTKLP